MNTNDFKITSEFLNYLVTIADEKRDTAGHNGAHHDGGAEALMSQVDAYEAGMRNRIPSRWSTYVKDFVQSKDSEYIDYLRLKKKFEK